MPSTANSSIIGEQRAGNSDINEKSGASDGRDSLPGGPQNMMLHQQPIIYQFNTYNTFNINN